MCDDKVTYESRINWNAGSSVLTRELEFFAEIFFDFAVSSFVGSRAVASVQIVSISTWKGKKIIITYYYLNIQTFFGLESEL